MTRYASGFTRCEGAAVAAERPAGRSKPAPVMLVSAS